jgi:formamidopyrimidine-DNA glycosylase
MPELPEVETVCRGLRETVLGRTIKRVEVRAPKSSIVVGPSFGRQSFAGVLSGREIHAIDRRGKNILMRLSGDVTLWVHLKMTGHFFYLDPSKPLDKHDLVIFDFTPDGNGTHARHLRFHDYRRFGRLRLFPDSELFQQDGLRDLGPEPFMLNPDDFAGLCRNSHRMIKPALLDQTFIAGLGNIYADEALYASRIHPMRLTSSLSRRKLHELHEHIIRLLNKAIRLMGTSVDTYTGVNGQAGHFQKYLLAYDREGTPCGRCGALITRRKIGSRSAHFCPRCQRVR